LPSALGIDRLLVALDNKFGARVDPTISVWNNNPINFAVLPGDYNGDGVVNSQDQAGVQSQESAPTPVVWADLDGNGAVNGADVKDVQHRIGTRLP
jgi:hypothetical protein